jgi:hypothetical protein
MDSQHEEEDDALLRQLNQEEEDSFMANRYIFI